MVFIRTKISPAERIDSKDIFKKIFEEGKKNPNLFFGLKGRKKIPMSKYITMHRGKNVNSNSYQEKKITRDQKTKWQRIFNSNT